MTGTNKPKKLLVLDTSYSLEDIIKRGNIKSVTCRDLNGYFDHVWSVHPIASLVTSPEWGSPLGLPVSHFINERHTFIEGKAGRFSFLKRIAPLNFILSQIAVVSMLKRLIQKENISLIRVGDALYLGLMGWLLSRMCRIPFVVRVGGNSDKVYETTGQPMQKRLFFNRKTEKKVERFVFSRAHLVAGANRDNLNFALANGAREDKSTIFRYGNLLYEGHFTPPTERKNAGPLLKDLGFKESDKFLMYIGRMEKVKHPDHVIKVLSELRTKGYDLKAILVGEGVMAEELKDSASELGIENEVSIPGNQNQEWLATVIPAATVVMSPHTGRALSEAALAGSPVVAYDIDWQAEIIENKITGLLVPHGNLGEFCTATERFIKDEAFAKKMGTSLRERALEMLDPVKLDDHEKRQYDLLLASYAP